MLGAAAVVHALLFALIIGIGMMRPVRLSPAGFAGSSIGAYVSDAIGTVTRSAPKPAVQKKSVLATKTAAAAKEDEQSGGGGQAGAPGVTQSGPVRIGAGGTLSLIKRVEPAYPPIMRTARMTGQVVLDAIINPDGTIGDVKVLRSTNDAFAQSAIAAVKQWRYSPPGFEAILTVSVNYTLT